MHTAPSLARNTPVGASMLQDFALPLRSCRSPGSVGRSMAANRTCGHRGEVRSRPWRLVCGRFSALAGDPWLKLARSEVRPAMSFPAQIDAVLKRVHWGCSVCQRSGRVRKASLGDRYRPHCDFRAGSGSACCNSRAIAHCRRQRCCERPAWILYGGRKSRVTRSKTNQLVQDGMPGYRRRFDRWRCAGCR